MKKLLAILCISSCLALALAGCAGGGAASSASSTAEESSVPASAASSEESSAATGMPNPWSDVASLEEAAAGAGLDSFVVPLDANLSGQSLQADWATYRCMDGLAEVQIPVGAVEMIIRKGLASAAVDPGDISGDYNEYANTWTQDIGGVEVTCFGNREGEATKSIWAVGDNLYSILAIGAGGDTDFGLAAEDLATLVSGIQ